MNIGLYSLRLTIIIISLIASSVSYAASSVRISSDAPGGKIGINETFHITIDATNCTGSIELSSLPQGVKKVYSTTRQTSRVAVINGTREQENTTSLIITCKGETPGKYTFGPVSIDGKKSNVISYQVVESTGRNTNSNANINNNQINQNSNNTGPLFVGNGNEEIFLKASVNKTKVYEQEAIEYSVTLYTTYGDIKFLGAAAAPKFEGFVVEESSDVSKSFSFEEYKGQTFKTAVIAKYIIFPQKAGKLKILGNTYTVSTDAKQYYHDPYYQTITVKQPIQLNVKPNDIEIEVKGLPTPIPANFIGGVGNFSLKSYMPSTKLSTNSASLYNITVEGSGNIKYVKIPDFNSYLPSSFEIYTPEVSNDIKVGSTNVSGSTKFEYSIIPKESGDYKIPVITFTYFNPESGQYETLSTSQYDLMVITGKSSSRSQSATSFNDKLLPIGNLSKKAGLPYVYNFFYWLWYIIPIGLFIISLIIYRKRIGERSDMILFRSKNANKMALKRLAVAYSYYKDHKEEEFYDAMLSALWGYLADKLKIPTSQLNRSNVSEELRKHGVKESTFSPIINLIDECEYAKYTPVSRMANMKQLYTEAVESITNVEEEYQEQIKKGETLTHDENNAYTDNYVNSSLLNSTPAEANNDHTDSTLQN